MAGVVDADTHIAESKGMWNYMKKRCSRAGVVLDRLAPAT